MVTLYKYYSPKLDVIEYLKKPSIKLSTTESFNDPFEESLPNKLAKELAKSISESDMLIYTKPQYQLEQELTKQYKEASKDLGIISLTESHKNLLMWAHYADSHKGVCIGYKKEFLSNSICFKRDAEYNDLLPKKVTYDKIRFDPIRLNEFNSPYDIIMQILTTKSDEWMYEKEHRCIANMWHADEFIFGGTLNSKAHKIIKTQVELGRISEQGNERYRFVEGHGGAFCLDLMSHIADYIHNLGSVTMFKTININDIESIFFGCRTPSKTVQKTKELIQSDPKRYGHIKVFKYRANKESFDLDLIKVVNGTTTFNHQALTSKINEGIN